MGDVPELSLSEMPMHDHHSNWTDGHIKVQFCGFTPHTGDIRFQVTEERGPIGLYYIWIIYGPDSGPPPGPPAQASFTYDGNHPKRLELMKDIVIRTPFPTDPVRGIKVKKIRD